MIARSFRARNVPAKGWTSGLGRSDPRQRLVGGVWWMLAFGVSRILYFGVLWAEYKEGTYTSCSTGPRPHQSFTDLLLCSKNSPSLSSIEWRPSSPHRVSPSSVTTHLRLLNRLKVAQSFSVRNSRGSAAACPPTLPSASRWVSSSKGTGVGSKR